MCLSGYNPSHLSVTNWLACPSITTSPQSLYPQDRKEQNNQLFGNMAASNLGCVFLGRLLHPQRVYSQGERELYGDRTDL